MERISATWPDARSRSRNSRRTFHALRGDGGWRSVTAASVRQCRRSPASRKPLASSVTATKAIGRPFS